MAVVEVKTLTPRQGTNRTSPPEHFGNVEASSRSTASTPSPDGDPAIPRPSTWLPWPSPARETPAVKRTVILGPGGAGKSVFAHQLGEATGLPVVELDQLFWKTDLTLTPPDEWAAVQEELVTRPAWIPDGDLGPYDVVEVRLSAADTVIILDISRWRCAWRTLRRSRERWDFWR